MNRREWTIRIVALVLGLGTGWFVNDALSSRYVLHIADGLFRINSRTGIVWHWDGNQWKIMQDPLNSK